MPSAMYPCFSIFYLLFISSAQGQGYRFSHCLSDSDCRGDLSCKETSIELPPCQGIGKYCICAPGSLLDFICNDSSDCDEGETCSDLLFNLSSEFDNVNIDGICMDNSQLPFLENPKMCETDLDCPAARCIASSLLSICGANITELSRDPSTPSTGNPVAVNESPVASEPNLNAEEDSTQESVLPESSTGGGDACISWQALSHLPSASLRYAKHRKAAVLCDSIGNCATPGHLVIYQGQAMMMRSYCRMVGCSTDVMHVNSPRFKRGLRIKSNSNDLEFLAFAARYGSSAEENLFKAAVWLGL